MDILRDGEQLVLRLSASQQSAFVTISVSLFTHFLQPRPGCTWSGLSALQGPQRLLEAKSAFGLSLPLTSWVFKIWSLVSELIKFNRIFQSNLTCSTQHASQRHCRKTFAHRSHTPENMQNLENLRNSKIFTDFWPPYSCPLPLLVVFSFPLFCCSLTPSSAQPGFWMKILFFSSSRVSDGETSASDFHSLLTASKIFLGLLFAFSQI